MNQIPEEECPICWRSFSNTVSPMTLVCGHSLCEDCSEDLKKCPLCRRKITATSRATNYSLVSLIEKLERVEQREFKDQEVQTEKIKRARSCSTIKPLIPPPYGQVLVSPVIAAINKLTKIQQMLAKTFNFNLNFPSPN
jgi:hypothetical protein